MEAVLDTHNESEYAVCLTTIDSHLSFYLICSIILGSNVPGMHYKKKVESK